MSVGADNWQDAPLVTLPYTSDPTPNGALTVQANEPVDDWYDTTEKTAWWKLQLASGVALTLDSELTTTNGTDSPETILALYELSGGSLQHIYSDQGSGAGNNSRFSYWLDPGTYYVSIGVSDFVAAFYAEHNYVLRIQTPVTSSWYEDHNGTNMVASNRSDGQARGGNTSFTDVPLPLDSGTLTPLLQQAATKDSYIDPAVTGSFNTDGLETASVSQPSPRDGTCDFTIRYGHQILARGLDKRNVAWGTSIWNTAPPNAVDVVFENGTGEPEVQSVTLRAYRNPVRTGGTGTWETRLKVGGSFTWDPDTMALTVPQSASLTEGSTLSAITEASVAGEEVFDVTSWADPEQGYVICVVQQTIVGSFQPDNPNDPGLFSLGGSWTITVEYTLKYPRHKWILDGAPSLTWWDGSERQPCDLLGWWDGSAVQPAVLRGWWDGSAVQPIIGGS